MCKSGTLGLDANIFFCVLRHKFCKLPLSCEDKVKAVGVMLNVEKCHGECQFTTLSLA